MKWELTKIKIKEFSIAYSIKRARQKKDNIKTLQNRLDDIVAKLDISRPDEILTEEKNAIESKIDQFYAEKDKGIQIRSKVDPSARRADGVSRSETSG